MQKNHKITASVKRRKFYLLLSLAAAAAFLLRLFAAYEMGSINGGINSVFTPSSASDLCTYMRLAREVANGTYSGVFYYQPYYYAVFLPAIYLALGAGVWPVIIIQCLLGGATAWFAGLAGARIFGRKAGVPAAWMTAISVPLILYAPFHQNETLQTFHITLTFFLLLLAMSGRKMRYVLLTGIVTGIGILTRGNFWFFVPVIVSGLLLSQRRNLKRAVPAILLFLLMVLLVQLPFAAYNSRILGRLSGPSTAADAVLALGNTWEAPPGGRNVGLPAGPMEYPEAWHRAMARTTEGVSLPRQMMEMLAQHPGAFLELQFRKLLLFWEGGEIPNNVSLYGEGQYSIVLKYMFPGSSSCLLALGIAGLLLFLPKLFRRGKHRLLMLYGFIILYWGAVSAFYILSRFRAPVIPLVTIAGGGFLAAYLKSFKEDKKRFLNRTALLLFSIWFVSFANDFYRDHCEAAVMRLVRPQGTVLPARKNYPEVRFDHGPFSFGNWETRELAAGRVLEKTFTSPGNKAKWSIYSPVPGNLICRTPGGAPRVFQLKKGISEITLGSAGTRAVLEILSAPPGAGAVFDRQRNYGRSRENNAPLPGEWVVRSIAEQDR